MKKSLHGNELQSDAVQISHIAQAISSTDKFNEVTHVVT